MIFRRYATLESKLSATELRKSLVSKHLQIHDLDFEIFQIQDDIKIIPHAETEDHIYTLPITKLRVFDKGSGSQIKMMSKPRRIDIGGPYLIMIFVVFAIVTGILLYFFGEGKYTDTAYAMVGVALFIFLILWYRLERGYFDYIRKIKAWVQGHI